MFAWWKPRVKSAPKVRVDIKPRPDGYGYLYGEAVADNGERCRVDIMPPLPEWRGDTMLDGLGRPHATDWVVYRDGEEIARVTRIEDLAASIAPKLIARQ
jgi:hypothetical protein